MAEIIVLEVRKAREMARSTDAVARQLEYLVALLELLSAWLALNIAVAKHMHHFPMRWV